MGPTEKAVKELASIDYPRVWIGEEGMTPEELLHLQNSNYEERQESWEVLSREKR